MRTLIHPQVEAARSSSDPAVICRLPSGWVTLANMQFLRGYSILSADPVVTSINDLDAQHRAQYLCDMTLVGDAIMEVTGAYRINYAIMGNSTPSLHAHIVPRYLNEPDELRKGLPWSYDQTLIDAMTFDAGRDRELIRQLTSAIQKRL